MLLSVATSVSEFSNSFAIGVKDGYEGRARRKDVASKKHYLEGYDLGKKEKQRAAALARLRENGVGGV